MKKFIPLQSAYNVGLLTSEHLFFDVITSDGLIFEACTNRPDDTAFYHSRSGDIISIPIYDVIGVRSADVDETNPAFIQTKEFIESRNSNSSKLVDLDSYLQN